MRVQLKLALAFLTGLIATAGMNRPAVAGFANLPLSGPGASAHVALLLEAAYHDGVQPVQSAFCYSQHIQCRLDTGYGWRYRECMRRRRCAPAPDGDDGGYDNDDRDGDIYEHRREGRSCHYWYDRCRSRWYYPENVVGCMRFYGCD